MDFTHRESTTVDMAPERLYDLLTSIERTGEWSPICARCEWDEGAEPVVGARFTGFNELPERSWQTRATVVAADPGREFAWEIGEGWVRWGWELSPAGTGTELTETWEFLPAGLAMFKDAYGDRADAEIAVRTAQAHTGIPVTLAAVKKVAEAS